MTLNICLLRELDPQGQAEMDRVIQSVRPALTGRNGQLERIQDRLEEARFDPCRWLYAAVQDGEAVGFVDAAVHYPDLESMTVAQLAVAETRRHRGVGSALVHAVARQALGSGILWVAASTRLRSADGFWTALGFEPMGAGRFRRSLESFAATTS